VENCYQPHLLWVLATVDPLALGEACDLCLHYVTRVLIVEVLHAGGKLEARLTDQAFLLALLAAQAFLLDQQCESLGKGQALVGTDLFQLALQGADHAAEFELTQCGQGLCCHGIFSLG